MNTIEIENYLRNFPNFAGVYPRDFLPVDLKLNKGIIINTDASSEPGEHWVSIFKNINGVIYFDSFGLPPLHEEIIIFLNRISNYSWFFNTITFQSTYQDTCGMYCIFFLTIMFKYGDFNEFRAIFNSHPEYNDVFAKIIYKIQTE